MRQQHNKKDKRDCMHRATCSLQQYTAVLQYVDLLIRDKLTPKYPTNGKYSDMTYDLC